MSNGAQSDVERLMMFYLKANLLLVATTYHVPFCGFTLLVCKYNMQFTIMKCKVQRDGQDASHIALVEPSWVYKIFTTSFHVI